AEHGFTANELDLGSNDEARRNRVGDLVFDQIRRASFPIGIDDDLHIAQIGNGIERSLRQRPNATSDAEDDKNDDEESVSGAGLDDALQQERLLFRGCRGVHVVLLSAYQDLSAPCTLASASMRKFALVTTRSVSFRPDFTS